MYQARIVLVETKGEPSPNFASEIIRYEKTFFAGDNPEKAAIAIFMLIDHFTDQPIINVAEFGTLLKQLGANKES